MGFAYFEGFQVARSNFDDVAAVRSIIVNALTNDLDGSWVA
jgi:hypothetical protein